MRKASFNNIIVVGFGSSGSSAIIDYLYDLGCFKGFGMDYPSETRILNQSFVNTLENLFSLKNDLILNKNDFLALMSGGRFGLIGNPNSNLIKSILIKNSKMNKRSTKVINYINSIKEKEKIVLKDSKILLELNRHEWDKHLKSFSNLKIYRPEEVKKSCINIISNMIRIMNEDKMKIIFNNDAHIWNSDSYYTLDSFLNLLVFRNPLDQYARKLNFTDFEEERIFKRIKSLLGFIKYYNISLIASLFKALKKSNLILVHYDQFILNENYRNQLVKIVLGKTKPSPKPEKIFNLDYSLTNIKLPRKKLRLEQVILIAFFCYPIYLIARVFSKIN